ncbi:hypothetical protein CEQ90_19640 [Lewinellaceae bacterium SD302]|nr:hypothetical protein CEQ90_19640 [Lewinellaceae bacterium SD302]
MKVRWCPNQIDFPAGIAKSHGRPYAVYLFFNFVKHEVDESLLVHLHSRYVWLGKLRKYLTGIEDQNQQASARESENMDNLPLITCGISKRGLSNLKFLRHYEDMFTYLPKPSQQGKIKKLFNQILYTKKKERKIRDADGVIMIAAKCPNVIEEFKEKINNISDDAVTIAHNVYCRRHYDAHNKDDFRGPLGYYDGISNPRDAEAYELVKRIDPFFSTDNNCVYGSTMSLVQIQINPKVFADNIDSTIDEILEEWYGREPGRSLDKERDYLREELRSVYMGRYSNGRPRTEQFKGVNIKAYSGPKDHDNDWGFDIAKNGTPAYCPHFAHIRAANPRLLENKSPTIVRRGMNYLHMPEVGTEPQEAKVAGLLFIAFHRDFGRLKTVLDQLFYAKDPISYHGQNVPSPKPDFLKKLSRLLAKVMQLEEGIRGSEEIEPEVDMRFQIESMTGKKWEGEFRPERETHLARLAQAFFYFPPLRFFKYAESLAAQKN